MISELQIKQVLTRIMKNHMKAILAQKEEQEDMINELQSTSGGGYARQMIARIIQGYKDNGCSHDDPYDDLDEMMELFYSDKEINNFKTMVCGNDLIEMLGLFHDLAEESRGMLLHKIEEMEKYKIAYNNRVRRDKKAAEEKMKNSNENDD